MLASLDRTLRYWHLWAANGLAVAWFLGITVASRMAVPDVAVFRCPVGFCAGGYSPAELRGMLDAIEENGREFLRHTLLPLDLMLPALLLGALVVTYVWLSHPHRPMAVPLSPAARCSLLSVPLLYCLADYGENAALAEILDAYPAIDDHIARRASFLTAAKSQLVAASLGIALALAIAAWGTAYGSRRRSGG